MQDGSVFVDHAFLLIEPQEVETTVAWLAAQGLRESSRRSHVGLGTSNIFYCFDNVFLEILWIANRDEASRTCLGQMLIERVAGRTNGASPFGIGLRTRAPDVGLPFATFEFVPPETMSFKPIAIAESSRNAHQPVLFRAQRTLRPDAWTDGQAGERQQASGLTEATALEFTPPHDVAPSPDLCELERRGLVSLAHAQQGPALRWLISHANSPRALELVIRSPVVQRLGA